MAKKLTKKPTRDEILRTNKKVDPNEIGEIAALRKRRRALGYRRRSGYDLAMPVDRHRVTVVSSPDADPRRVQLRSSNPAAE